MKISLYITCTSFLLSTWALGQSVGINNTSPHVSAILDVKSFNKGMLLPRTSTSSRNAIANPAKGLILYDTTAAAFYFYNGTVWTQLSAGSSGWSLTGNAGVNPSSNFIGTVDEQPLRFRVNNLWAGEVNSTNSNVFFGLYAGKFNSTGTYNTANGTYSLYANTDGSYNTGIGVSALFLNTIGSENTAIGTFALSHNTTAGQNIALGNEALGFQSFSNGGTVWVSGNTAVGYRSLYANEPTANTNGIHNTAIGSESLFYNSTGYFNTASGYRTLYNNNGIRNTAAGATALYNNSSGFNNTATGASALYNNTTGNFNTATGSQALYFNKTGQNNTANGFNALYANSGGQYNTAVGNGALQYNTSGSFNTANGSEGLFYNETGGLNTANGYEALASNIDGGYNTADGVYALKSNTSGGYNTATGVNAMLSNKTGLNNTAIGFQALYNIVTGSNNIAIGTNAGPAPGSPNITNTIGIGNNDYQNNTNNQVLIGNLSTTYYAIHGSWTTFSDARIKTGIAEEVKGLDFINRLRPVTYFKNIKAITTLTGNKETADFEGKYDIEKIKFSGFLAQEVEQAAKESGYDFSGLHTPQSRNDLYALSYETFVVPLVKAVQEQQEIIDRQKTINDNQQKEIDALKERLDKLEKQLTTK